MIAGSEHRNQLIATLKTASARRPEKGAGRFTQRNGPRVVEDRTTVGPVICFECSWFTEYRSGNERQGASEPGRSADLRQATEGRGARSPRSDRGRQPPWWAQG